MLVVVVGVLSLAVNAQGPFQGTGAGSSTRPTGHIRARPHLRPPKPLAGRPGERSERRDRQPAPPQAQPASEPQPATEQDQSFGDLKPLNTQAQALVMSVVDERTLGPVTRSRLTLRVQPAGGRAVRGDDAGRLPHAGGTGPGQGGRHYPGPLRLLRPPSGRRGQGPRGGELRRPLFEGLFVDRADAGRVLGEQVAGREELVQPVVVALPRGGVPVGAEVARRIGASLVAMPVSKVGAPGREELAIGAVAPGGVRVLNPDVIAALRLSDERWTDWCSSAAERVARQSSSTTPAAQRRALTGRSVVVVDDGLATGASMRAALIAVRRTAPPTAHPGRACGPSRTARHVGAARRRGNLQCAAGVHAGRGRMVRGLQPDYGGRSGRPSGRVRYTPNVPGLSRGI